MHPAVYGLALLLLVTYAGGYSSDYYCSVNLCPHGGPNVGCNPPPATGGRYCYGKSARAVKMTKSLQAHLLHLHNYYRSKLASGRQPPFSQATRMYTMVWDDELAAQAGHNARSCQFAHDQCRNTPEFQYSGQNLAIRSYYGFIETVEDSMTKIVSSWWNEYRYAKPSYLKSFPRSMSKWIGHFTMLVHDGAWKLGCAMQQWNEGVKKKVYLVCNYSYTNIIGRPVYNVGPVGSKCQAGLNPAYPGLCRT
uniref:Venom allergen-1 n=1 Tax=Anopheles atroparvus TaxID=41427 RepID=A0A182JM83_ANOAO